MIKIELNPKKLYEACILSSLTHAVAVGMYPELNYEHSWDKINYSMNDSEGCRATITFHKNHIITVFQDSSCVNADVDALDFFEGAPKEIIELAKNETLQYVLENVDGIVKPVISSAFWGDWNELYSIIPFDEVVDKGAHIITVQLLPFKEAMEEWSDYYELDEDQIEFIKLLHEQKIKENKDNITLSNDDIKYLYGDVEECLISLREMNIIVED
jgi:hypothetical protein